MPMRRHGFARRLTSTAFEERSKARNARRGRARTRLRGAAAALRRALRPDAYPDQEAAEHYQRRSENNLRRLYDHELASTAEAVAFEQGFGFELPAGDDGAPVRVNGIIDRIDRHPNGAIEVIDYKTGRTKSQAQVDADEQLSTYALALRSGAVVDPTSGASLPPASLLSLYFTESGEKRSTIRTDEQLDLHATHLVDLAGRIRSGAFAATPSWNACQWCDYRRICPSRWGGE